MKHAYQVRERNSSVSPFEKKFFASSNSAKGFYNDYHACFGEGSGVEHLYVIKGGPGTGKSHFMRTVARYASARGYDVTYYYCSSDPASLDGIRLTKAGEACVGMVDGTAPHVWEPVLPGVQEEIVNLGSFWDGNALSRSGDMIKKLSECKSACYGRAYRYLAACGQTTQIADELLSSCVLRSKLKALSSRLVREQKGCENAKIVPAHLRAVGMTGQTFFDTYIRMAESAGGEMIRIQDYYGVGYMLTAEIFALAEKKKCPMLISRNPIHTSKIDGIYFADPALCIVVAEPTECPSNCRTVSLRRYVDPVLLKEKRSMLRHALGLTETLTQGAVHSLEEAGEYHFELEKLYAAAMNFSAKEAYTQAFCLRAFGE